MEGKKNLWSPTLFFYLEKR